AEAHPVPGIGVERAGAPAAQRVGRVDRGVAGAAQVRLVGDVGEAELVGAGKGDAGGLRQSVEALHGELAAQPVTEAEVQTAVVAGGVALPDAEVPELRE